MAWFGPGCVLGLFRSLILFMAACLLFLWALESNLAVMFVSHFNLLERFGYILCDVQLVERFLLDMM